MRWPHRRRRPSTSPTPAPVKQIVQPMPCYCLTGPHRGAAVEGELRYDPADPFAVRVVLYELEPGLESAEWTFARELLSGGLTEPTGSGNVRVAPAPRPTGTIIELPFADSPGSIDTLRQLITDFLTATYDLVPAGTETDRVDLDAALGGLRGRGW